MFREYIRVVIRRIDPIPARSVRLIRKGLRRAARVLALRARCRTPSCPEVGDAAAVGRDVGVIDRASREVRQLTRRSARHSTSARLKHSPNLNGLRN